MVRGQPLGQKSVQPSLRKPSRGERDPGPATVPACRTSLRASFWIALGVTFLALLAYAKVWGVLPAADDFGPPLYDIWIGRQSFTELITETRQTLRIRPLQSLCYWLAAALAGTGDDLLQPRLHAVIHGASLLAHIAHFTLAIVIARRFLGWSGSTLTALVVALHPAGVAGVASVDGLSTVLSAVALWGPVAYAVHFPDRPRRILTLALGALTLSFLQKEYILCMTAVLPFALWALPLDRDPASQRKNALAVGAALLTWAICLLALRYALYPASLGGLGDDAAASRGSVISPLLIAKNLGLTAAGLGFFGNTATLFTRANPSLSLFELGWSVVILLGALWGGWTLYRGASDTRAARLLGASLVCVPLSLTPELLVTRLSEMYLAMALLPFGLAWGACYEALAERLKAPGRRVLATFGGTTTLLLLSSVWSKVALMVESGELAAKHVRLMREAIPEDVRDTEVHVVFDAEMSKRPGYSVYRVPERHAAASDWTLLSMLPGRNLRLVAHDIESPTDWERLQRETRGGLWLHYRSDLERYVPLVELAR
jgi:hypothetical protein